MSESDDKILNKSYYKMTQEEVDQHNKRVDEMTREGIAYNNKMAFRKIQEAFEGVAEQFGIYDDEDVVAMIKEISNNKSKS